MVESFNKNDGVSLKEYFDAQLKAYNKAMCLKIAAVEDKSVTVQKMSQTAIDKAEDTVNIRLEMMNEFRSAMKDQSKENVATTMFNATVDSLENRIKSLELDRAELKGKASQTSLIIVSVGAVLSIILSIVNLLSKFGGRTAAILKV